MIMFSRIEMEQRIRTSELLREAQAAKLADAAASRPVRVSGSVGVQSQFFGRRFGSMLDRLKLQTA
jgi:hypothetical protein